MTALWIVVGILVVLCLAEAFGIVALAREVGLLSLRVPPAPALELGQGPGLGNPLPACSVAPLGTDIPRDLYGPSAQTRVLIFLSAGCASCRDLLYELNGTELDWPDHEFIPVVSGTTAEVQAMLRESRYRGTLYRDDGQAMKSAGVSATPTAVAVDRHGIVVAQGIVNTREMVSSLLRGHVRVKAGLLELDAVNREPRL